MTRYVYHVHRDNKCVAAWIIPEAAQREKQRKGGQVIKVLQTDNKPAAACFEPAV